MKSQENVKQLSPTRELIRNRALETGAKRTKQVQDRVRQLMIEIETEIAENGGTYPHNGGALSGAELARRAQVHPTTFFSPKQRELGAEVKRWLISIKECKTIGRESVRKSFAERISDWKSLYEGLAQSHRDTELELQQTEFELEEARNRVKSLEATVEKLNEQLSMLRRKKVVPISK